MNYIIREIRAAEIPLLKDFLYESIYQKDTENLIPRSEIEKPSISVYIDDYGKSTDNCLVAEVDGQVVGAVWTRIIEGFGHIDNDTPEFAISLYKEYRGYGIGKSLMREMIELLREKGFKRASLAVQKENYAVRMYKSVGFEVIGENEEEYIMLIKL